MTAPGISQHGHEYQLDSRTKQLWSRLDLQGKGELDLNGLQLGLHNLGHPMKNADHMLQQMFQEADTNRDGKIQFHEFQSFVRQAEAQLWNLFQSIDTDKDGKVDKLQMERAFERAGIAVPKDRLNKFFNHVDNDNDGYISYLEWRDYLIFMPPSRDSTSLHAVLSFWSSIVTLNAEGDSLVSDESLHHTSKNDSLLHILFGSIVRIAAPGDAERALKYQTTAQNASGVQRTADPSPTTLPKPTNSASTTHPTQITQDPAEASIQEPTTAYAVTGRKRNTLRVPNGTEPVMNPTTTQALVSSPEISMASPGTNMALAEEFLEPLEHDLLCPQEDESTDYAATTTSTAEPQLKLSDFVPDPGYFLAGAIAGGVSRTATAPLDRLKVFLLVNTNVTHGADSVMGALKMGKPLNAISNSMAPIRSAVLEIWSQNGMRSFFAGNGLNVIKIMPETAIKFGTYEAVKRAMANFEGHNDTKQISSWSKFASGGLAGIVAQFCVYPLDTLKFRLQCETVKDGPKGNELIIATAKRMYQTGGMQSAYRGVTMGLIGMFPYSAIDMSVFEFLKKTYKSYVSRRQGIPEDEIEPGNLVTGMIGASSGAFGATVVYPLNVLRTRLQTQGTHMHRATYTGIWDVAHQTLKNEGVRGLYKGLTPNLLKVAPALSITWVVYENSKRFLRLE
ncbi:Calcium-binding mitochondrial carrier SAL1 [Ceratocystis fimbriata CBS 114723]|uniref:Mitochondrial thiamine pyrophosphate carrier 1 n=1 Tax=Ceratocystis fimbriata CBS 114723 TaxID=1035309 RepID=A0A2C5X5J1_9PEZI|nr:Calcium-binding mitochondrial carrier SAL1 [Ceratocystis fimbriata CBS 114723]